jgi:hypothetical protein
LRSVGKWSNQHFLEAAEKENCYEEVEMNHLPNAEQAKKMPEADLTEALCAYYSAVKGRPPSPEQRENLGVQARYYQERRTPHWADVKRYLDETNADQRPSAFG